MRTVLLFLFVLLFGVITPAAHSGTPQYYISTADVGVNGIYKNGLWTPITVQWVCPLPKDAKPGDDINGGFCLLLSSVDSDGVPIEYRFDVSNPKIEKIADEKAFCRYECYAKLGRCTEPLTISLCSLHNGKDNILAKQILYPFGNPTAAYESSVFFNSVPNEKPVYLIIGNKDIGLQEAVAELSLREDRRPLLVKVKSVSDLPTQWFGYEAVDTLVITTTEPELFKGLTSESPQIKAIEQWLKLGGRILFCAGKDAGQFLEKENSPLRPFLPGKYERMTEMRKSSVLETFCESKRQIFMNGTNEAPYLKMPYFSEPKGIVFLKDLDLPLVSRSAYGFGVIIYFGGDLSGRPLSVWKARTTLVRNIMQWNTEKITTVRSSGSLLQLGYSDISGQIRSALDKFDGVKILPFSVILIILAVYFLAVGPADWFLVHRILKNPVLTWITFPSWIILFAVLAYCLGTAHRPNKVILNELTLLDYDTATGTQRYSTWAGLYSPGDGLFDLTVSSSGSSVLQKNQLQKPFNPDSVNTLTSWNGLPGSGLGGMSPKTVGQNVWTTKSFQQFYRSNTDDALVCGKITVPLQVRSTKSFFSQSWHFDNKKNNPVPYGTGKIDASIADEEGIPVGTLTLSKDSSALENVMLVYGHWVLELGTLKSGETIEVGKKTKRRELRDLLVQPGVLENQRLQQFSAYNMQSTDLDYIAKVFSFYGILGGFDAAGLYHSYHRNLEMSDIFSADRAVIIGTAVRTFCPGSDIPPINFAKETKINRHIVFRQPLPIKLTELSPRLGHNSGGISNKGDALAEPDKTIGGKGSYGDPSNDSKDNPPKK